MSSIPLPALDVRPQQQPENPIDQYGRLLQLRNALQMAPLQQQAAQQQVQAGQLENQQRQMDLQARQALNQAYAGAITKDENGNVSFDAGKLQQGLANGPAAYQTPQVMKGITDFQQSKINLQKSMGDLQQQSADMVGSAASAVKAAGYDPTLAHSLLDSLPQSPQLMALRSQIDGNPQNFQKMIDTAIANSPAQQKLQNAKDVAQIRMGTPDLLEMRDWMARNPGKSPADYQQFKVNQGVQADVSKETQIATNPQIQQGKVQVAAAEGAARANVEAQMARGSDAALAEVPPHLVAPATAAANKAGLDYAQAQSVTQRLQQMMDAAKNGNVVSYQLIPQEGALQVTTSQGVHRINMAEIQNYGGGSLWQQLQGHIGKALTGKSIPASVLNDMSQMQNIQEQGARNKYENDIKTINQTYGAKFQPIEMPTANEQNQSAPKAAAPTEGAIKTNSSGDKIVFKGGKWQLQQ